MTFRRFRALQEYWLEHPPTDFFAAGYFGYKPPGRHNRIAAAAPQTTLADFVRAVNSRS